MRHHQDCPSSPWQRGEEGTPNAGKVLSRGAYEMRPISLPTAAKTSNMRSNCASVWVAM
jgi:hypothetical protein